MIRDFQELTRKEKAIINRFINMVAVRLCKKTVCSAGVRRRLKAEYVRCGYFAIFYHLHCKGWSRNSENALCILLEKARIAMSKHSPFSSDPVNIIVMPKQPLGGLSSAIKLKIPEHSEIWS